MAGTSSNCTPATSTHCLASVECCGGVAAATGATDSTARAQDRGGDERKCSRIQPLRRLPFVNPGTFSHKTLGSIDSSKKSIVRNVSKTNSKQLMRYVLQRFIVECQNVYCFDCRAAERWWMEAFEASASLSSHNNRSTTQQSTGGVSGEGN
jgi:hypothetical protein